MTGNSEIFNARRVIRRPQLHSLGTPTPQACRKPSVGQDRLKIAVHPANVGLGRSSWVVSETFYVTVDSTPRCGPMTNDDLEHLHKSAIAAREKLKTARDPLQWCQIAASWDQLAEHATLSLRERTDISIGTPPIPIQSAPPFPVTLRSISCASRGTLSARIHVFRST